MAPTNKSLETRKVAGREPHDGLVERQKFATAERALEVAFKRQARKAVALQPAPIGGSAAASVTLGGFHGEFSTAKKFGGFWCVRAAVRPDGAYRKCRMDIEAGHAQRQLKRPTQDFGARRSADTRHGCDFGLTDAREDGVRREGGS